MGNQYVGFEFLINGFTHYGWAEISISTDSVTVKNWAYESAAAGVSAYKRRRKLAA